MRACRWNDVIGTHVPPDPVPDPVPLPEPGDESVESPASSPVASVGLLDMIKDVMDPQQTRVGQARGNLKKSDLSFARLCPYPTM